MINLDRDSGVSLVEQLVRQLRFQIASGRYRIGDTLPSTRVLASRLDVSFHTVRKAYGLLVDAGLVESREGRGFDVVASVTGATADRFEEGARVAAEAIQRLLALGLNDKQIEAILIEQLEDQQASSSPPEILFAAPYMELAKRCGELIESTVNMPVEATLIPDLDSHVNAEFVITPFAHLRSVISALPEAHAVGVSVSYSHEVLEALARLESHDTVAVAVLDSTSVEPIMIDIRRQTGFTGQVFGVSAYADRQEFTNILDQVDLLLYTHQSRRRVQPKVDGFRSVEMDHRISPESMSVIREMLASR